MLAELLPRAELKKDKNLRFEIKFNGNRAIATVRPNYTKLYSRSGRDMTANFPEYSNLHTYLYPGVYDTEICCFDSSGKSVFDLIQHRSTCKNHVDEAVRKYPTKIVLFDMLELGGMDITGHELYSRQESLSNMFKMVDQSVNPNILISRWYEDPIELFNHAEELHLEGIMGKNIHETYHQGKRDWLKVKVGITEDFYVCGYTLGTGKREKYFGALILGEYIRGVLTSVGSVGTGFNDNDLEMITPVLKSFESDINPFRAFGIGSKYSIDVKWIRSFELTARINYAERTSGNILRFASFKGLVK
jgi:bifunctional non-homologous end joining protein LigD